jgi:hypothetical protein
MPNPGFASLPLFLMLAAPAAVPVEQPRGLDGVQIAQLHIQQWVVIHINRAPAAPPPPPPIPHAVDPPQWREKHADKCIKTEKLAAAQVSGEDSVDLLLVDGKRMRAKLEADCPAINFYEGFYIKQQKDGKICATRDSLRLRSGGQCRIAEFRSLVPPKPPK